MKNKIKKMLFEDNKIKTKFKMKRNKRTKIFFDTEFTGLHQKTTLISIGLVSEDGKTFYAELTDYDKKQIDGWLQENVIDNLSLDDMKDGVTDYKDKDNIKFKGSMKQLKTTLKKWLDSFGDVEIWSDCLGYDWVLFCEIFGGALSLPKNIYYIPFDICTVFYDKGVDPDVSREDFAEIKKGDDKDVKKHNALWDAQIIKKCFDNLEKMG